MAAGLIAALVHRKGVGRGENQSETEQYQRRAVHVVHKRAQGTQQHYISDYKPIIPLVAASLLSHRRSSRNKTVRLLCHIQILWVSGFFQWVGKMSEYSVIFAK